MEDVAEAQFAPDGPIIVAYTFVNAVLDGEFKLAFSLTTPRFRRWMAEEWVSANAVQPLVRSRQTEALVEELAGPTSTGPLAEVFAQTNLADLQTILRLDRDRAAFATHPRPLGLDRELVLWVETGEGGPVVYEQPTALPAVGLVMAHQRVENESVSYPTVDGGQVENLWRFDSFQEPDTQGIVRA